MRIIAGDWKGRRLKPVKGLRTRPTSDKVKGAIFNILGSKVENASILDLFSGTGNLSYEALSRGARNAVLIEKSNAAWETIRENQIMLSAQNSSKVLHKDAFSYLNQNDSEKFDIIFVDPPYHQGLVDKVLALLKVNSRLNPKGVIIIETASDEEIAVDFLLPLQLMIRKEYGDTRIWFLQEKEEPREG